MTEQTITIILWAIPISLSLIIAILVSKETHKSIAKTLVCWVLPVIAGTLLAGAVMWGVLYGFMYLLGEAAKQFGILGVIGFFALFNFLTPTKASKPNK